MANKSGFHLELIPNMYEIGLFKFVLASQRRLRISCAVSILATVVSFFAIGRVLRYCFLPFWANSCLMLVLYIGAIAAAYIVALTIGDIWFAGPWREKMRLGSRFVPSSIDEEKALIRNKNFLFIVFWAISIAIFAFGADFVTGSNLRWYHTYGGLIHSMHSEDASEREAVLKSLSNAIHDKKWQNPDIRDQLATMIDDPDSAVRARAAYIVGRAKIVEAADGLARLLRDDTASDDARSEAAIALGRLEWMPARAHLLAVLRSTFATNHGDNGVMMSILYAFYEMQDQTVARDISEIVETCRDSGDCGVDLQAYAYFYLKSMRPKTAAALAFSVLDNAQTTTAQKCFAADLVRFTASKTDIPKIKSLFDKAPRDLECPVMYRKFHSEAAVVLFEKDTMRALFVRAVGNLKDAADYDWIWMVGANANENMRTRKVAEMYARALQK